VLCWSPDIGPPEAGPTAFDRRRLSVSPRIQGFFFTTDRGRPRRKLGGRPSRSGLHTSLSKKSGSLPHGAFTPKRPSPPISGLFPAKGWTRPAALGMWHAFAANVSASGDDLAGRVAQLVEQLTLNQRVHSSSLCAPTISSSEISYLRAAFGSPFVVVGCSSALRILGVGRLGQTCRPSWSALTRLARWSRSIALRLGKDCNGRRVDATLRSVSGGPAFPRSSHPCRTEAMRPFRTSRWRATPSSCCPCTLPTLALMILYEPAISPAAW
jgi:hypothetical protein